MMASYEGNLQALDRALARIFQQRSATHQKPLNNQAAAARTVRIEKAIPATWQSIDCAVYGISVANFSPRIIGTPIIQIALGEDRPIDTDIGTDPRRIVLGCGDSIDMPSGCSRVWYRMIQPEADTGYSPQNVGRDAGVDITFLLSPAITVRRGRPNIGRVRLSENRRVNYQAADPTSSAGAALHEQTNIVAITLADVAAAAGTDEQTARLSTTETVEVWWGTHWNDYYWHNQADDFAAGMLGVAGPDHDIEVYRVPPGAACVVLVSASTNDWAGFISEIYE